MGEDLSKKAINELDVEKAFKLLEFSENSSSTVKGRTWTITAWILTINSALFAFCFQLFKENADIFGFLYIEFAVCAVGVALCVFLFILIHDQGNHLQHYWTMENKIGAWNLKIRDLVLKPDEVNEVEQTDYKAPFPKFCVRLYILCGMFVVGFVGTFFLMRFLISHKP